VVRVTEASDTVITGTTAGGCVSCFFLQATDKKHAAAMHTDLCMVTDGMLKGY
jgi:hypothetical protein